MAGKQWPSARTIVGLWLVFLVPTEGLFWPFLQDVRPYDIRPKANQPIPPSDEIEPVLKKTDTLHQPGHLSGQEPGVSDQHHDHQHPAAQPTHHQPENGAKHQQHQLETGVQHPYLPPDSNGKQPYHQPDTGVQYPHHPPDSNGKQPYHQPDTGVQYPHHPPDSNGKQPYHRPDTGVQYPHNPPDSNGNQPYHRPDSGVQQTYHQPDSGVHQSHRPSGSDIEQPYHQPDSGVQNQHHQLESGVHHGHQQARVDESPRSYESVLNQQSQRSHRTDGNRQQPYRETGSRYKRPYYQTGTERSDRGSQTESAVQRAELRSSSPIKSLYGNVHHELQASYPERYGLNRDSYYRSYGETEWSGRLPDSRPFQQPRGGWEYPRDIPEPAPFHYMGLRRPSELRLYPYQRLGYTRPSTFGRSRGSVSEGSLRPRSDGNLRKSSRGAMPSHGHHRVQSVDRGREVYQDREVDMSREPEREYSAHDPPSQQVRDVYLPDYASSKSDRFGSYHNDERDERVDKIRRDRPFQIRGPSPMHQMTGDRVMKSLDHNGDDHYISPRSSREKGMRPGAMKMAHPDIGVSSPSNLGLRKRGYVFPQLSKYQRPYLRLNTPAEGSEPVDDVTKNPVEDLPDVSHKGGDQLPFRGPGLADILRPVERPDKYVPENRGPPQRKFKGILHYLSARRPDEDRADETPNKIDTNLRRPFIHIPHQPSAQNDKTPPPETTEGVDSQGLRHYYNIPGLSIHC